MEVSEVKSLIKTGFPEGSVEVDGDGYHFEALVVSDRFAGLNRVKRQQLVYATVDTYVKSGELHALSLKTYTPEEWQEAHG